MASTKDTKDDAKNLDIAEEFRRRQLEGTPIPPLHQPQEIRRPSPEPSSPLQGKQPPEPLEPSGPPIPTYVTAAAEWLRILVKATAEKLGRQPNAEEIAKLAGIPATAASALLAFTSPVVEPPSVPDSASDLTKADVSRDPRQMRGPLGNHAAGHGSTLGLFQSKRELVGEICRLDPAMHPNFLAQFEVEDLKVLLSALTRQLETRGDAQEVRKGEDDKKALPDSVSQEDSPSFGHKPAKKQPPSDPLAILSKLSAPKAPPQEIIELERLLATAPKVLPDQKQAFVNHINSIVNNANYCFQLEPDKAISRKLYLNRESSRDGDIQFRLTSGMSRGFLATRYSLIPYNRKYGNKTVS